MASPRSGTSGYDAVRARIASLTSASVDSEPYWAIESVTADVLILSGSADPWAMHDPDALERFYDVLRRFPGPVLGICAGMQMLVRAAGGIVSTVGAGNQGIRERRGARRFRSLRRQCRGDRGLQESRGRGEHAAARIPGPRDEP